MVAILFLWFYGSFLLFLLSLIAILICDSLLNIVAKFSDGCNDFKSLVYQFLKWKVCGCKVFSNYGNAIVVFLLQPLRFCKKLAIVSPYFGK